MKNVLVWCYLIVFLEFTQSAVIPEVSGDVMTYDGLRSFGAQMMEAAPSRMLCYDACIPKLIELNERDRAEFEACTATGQGKRSAIRKQMEQQHLQLENQLHNSRNILEKCAALQNSVEYLFCLSNENNDTQLLKGIGNYFPEKWQLDLKLLESYNRVIAIERGCTTSAFEKAKEERDLLFNDLAICLKNDSEDTDVLPETEPTSYSWRL